MEQKIALDPALGLRTADLVAAWNANPTTATHGPARTEAAPPGQFMDFADMGFMVVSNIALSLLSSYLYDLIKDAFADKPAPTVAIHQVEQSTGEKVVVVVVEKP
jgi:hypothetical protein